MGINVNAPNTGFNTTNIIKNDKLITKPNNDVKNIPTDKPSTTESKLDITNRQASDIPTNSVSFPKPSDGLGFAVSVKAKGENTNVAAAVSYSSGELKASVAVNAKGVGSLNVGVGDVNLRLNTKGQTSVSIKNGDSQLKISTGGPQGTTAEFKIPLSGSNGTEQAYDENKSKENLNSESEQFIQNRSVTQNKR